MTNTPEPGTLRIAVDAPVARATVMEDRAHVTRRGRIELGAGVQRLVIKHVAPVISDKTLMVKIAEGEATLIDARVGRERVLRDDEGQEVDKAKQAFELERELEALEEKIEVGAAALALLERHAAVADKVAKLSVTELGVDAAWGKDVGTQWADRLDALRDDEREVQRRIVQAKIEQSLLEEEQHRLRTRIQATANRLEKADAWIAIELDVAAAGALALTVEYIVPGACWRPYHTARLGARGAVSFRTDACVWQNTGEDWTGVELRLSTERPSLGVDPPELASDVVRARKKSETIQVQAREQAIETTGLGGEAVERPPQVPGIDDGGDVQLLAAQGAADVPSDGRPYRVAVGTFSSDAEVSLVCMPELADCVIGKSVQTNKGATPILAGPVDLIRDSGYVGRTSVLFIAPGERFELGWGPEPTLRVTRETEVQKEKSRMLSSWITRIHDVHVHLSNIGVDERSVEVTERVPISEIEKLEIATDAEHTTGRRAPDNNGFVTWTVTVPAHGTDQVDLRYVVKKHEDVQGF